MSERREKDKLPSWIYLGVTMFVLFLVFGVFLSFGIFVTIFIDHYHESNTKAGWAGSILFFFLGSIYPVVVYLRRRFGLRPVMFCSAVLVVFTFTSTPFMPSLNFVFLTYSIPFGISAGFLDCLSIITLREYFDKHLGLACGLRFASVATGGMTFNYFLPIFIERLSWKKTFFAFSSLGAAFVVYALVYRSRDSGKEAFDVISAKDQEIEASEEISRKIGASYGFVRNKGFLLVLTASALYFGICVVPAMFVIRHTKWLGYPLSKSKWTIVIHSLSSLLGRAGIGRIADIAMRYKRVKFIPPTAVILFGISCALCSMTKSLVLVTLYMGVMGCTDGIFWAVLQLLVLEVTKGENADYAYAFLVCVSSFGSLSGPPVMGRLYDTTGDFRDVLYAVSACAVIAGVIMAVGGCLASRGDSKSWKTEEKETTNCSKTYELSYFSLSGRTTVPILLDKRVVTMVQCESSV